MLEQLRDTWDALERRQQMMLVAAAVAAVGAVVAVGIWSTRPSWAVLYAEMMPADAQAVVEQLEEQGVPYRLTAGGSAVEVPRERLYELRLKLAGEGLPGGGSVGFELFDRTSFSASDLQNNVNLQRAIQGELERSIATLSEVSTCRVHLALPEERLFTEQQEAPSASVVVGLRGGRLGSGQVAAITQLVASAVPSLEPDAVTVVDTNGNVLSGGWDGSGGLLTMAQLEATRAHEERIRQHLQSMLDSVLGAGKSVVRVQAELDFESQQLTRRTLEPAGGEGLVTSEETTTEQYEGIGPRGEVGGPAGIDGTVADGTDAEGGRYEHRHERREYDYSRLEEQISRPPGSVRRLTVAVVIDDGLDTAVAGQVQQLVEAAAGIDPQRGDVVTVETMTIEANRLAEQQKSDETAETGGPAVSVPALVGGGILLAAMVAGGIVMARRRRRDGEKREVQAEPTHEAAKPAFAAADSSGEGLEFTPMSVEELRAQAGEAQAEEAPTVQEQSRLASTLSAMGMESPQDFAALLRAWMRTRQGDGAETEAGQ